MLFIGQKSRSFRGHGINFLINVYVVMLQCIPFWPSTDSMKLYVKYEDSNVSSQHFYIHTPHTTTLRMDKGVSNTAPGSWGWLWGKGMSFMSLSLSLLLFVGTLQGC